MKIVSRRDRLWFRFCLEGGEEDGGDPLRWFFAIVLVGVCLLAGGHAAQGLLRRRSRIRDSGLCWRNSLFSGLDFPEDPGWVGIGVRTFPRNLLCVVPTKKFVFWWNKFQKQHIHDSEERQNRPFDERSQSSRCDEIEERMRFSHLR